MNLQTRYLGLTLPHPLIVGASPFAHSLDQCRRLEDAGAAAIVMYSLFEEQVVAEQMATSAALDHTAESFAEATTYLPTPAGFDQSADEYLGKLQKLKAALGIPVIASLNGTSRGGWVRYAREMEQAGADALELNTYSLATDPAETGATIEEDLVALVREVRASVRIPLAVKLSPFFSSLPNLAERLADAGAGALALFNRFYQPDIDIDNLQVVRLNLSDSGELPMRLHFLAILYGRVRADLAVTGGVHAPVDVIKAVMCGASAVQLVSSLLQRGPEHLGVLRRSVSAWLQEREYVSLQQMLGSMSLLRCPNPHEYIRNNYMHLLDSWRSAEWAPR